MFFCIKSIISTFDTVNSNVVDAVNPMGAENSWFCVFEADWGCMETIKIDLAERSARSFLFFTY